MTKEEYVKTLEKEEDDNAQEAEDNGYGSGYYDGLDYAVDLAEKLDEPKKVVIPQFMADWIEEAKELYGSELDPLRIVYWTGDYISDNDSHYQWLENIYNQKLLLNAITNGYEVENEIEKYVRLKGFAGTTGYLNYDVTFEEFFVDTTELDSCTKIKFTKSWLKDNWSEYEAYNNAGLLDFEEVEDE
ncbi:DUF1642 domain-containing protein [Pediococcus pentosaceus]|uniref:DUF1642 domain-containing protein n=1 Tax=Pediococcus pentosaceus TaxID=1255 RepID=UPI0018FEDACC|nr:DUF1642 domain-containing protein [Pediococcus pentosaceus]MBF7122788.1 DUF1642 domain-containing protein [Pediococcus pentosaceus]